MSANQVRFYSDVSVQPISSPKGVQGIHGYRVLLDGKSILTPAGKALMLPLPALAEAVAMEWRNQGEEIQRQSMYLTRLADTAIDRVSANRSEIIDQILAFGRSDLVCYRADAPIELVQRQALVWDPLLKWISACHNVPLKMVSGVRFSPQAVEALTALKHAIGSHGDFALAGLHAAAVLTGSAVIALALAEGEISPTIAFDAAHLEESFQAERWGVDAAAAAARMAKRYEFIAVAQFLGLLETRYPHDAEIDAASS